MVDCSKILFAFSRLHVPTSASSSVNISIMVSSDCGILANWSCVSMMQSQLLLFWFLKDLCLLARVKSSLARIENFGRRVCRERIGDFVHIGFQPDNKRLVCQSETFHFVSGKHIIIVLPVPTSCQQIPPVLLNHPDSIFLWGIEAIVWKLLKESCGRFVPNRHNAAWHSSWNARYIPYQLVPNLYRLPVNQRLKRSLISPVSWWLPLITASSSGTRTLSPLRVYLFVISGTRYHAGHEHANPHRYSCGRNRCCKPPESNFADVPCRCRSHLKYITLVSTLKSSVCKIGV